MRIEDIMADGIGEMLRIWEFDNAPKALQELTDNQDDCTLIAIVPQSMTPSFEGTLLYDKFSEGYISPEVRDFPEYRVYFVFL